ncbi:MAG: hypothetical protein R3F17_05210 [Planctomycetota bacterium]
MPGAIEWGLYHRHVHALRAGQSIDKPRYDFSTHTRRPGSEWVHSRPVILLEGILVLAEEQVRECMDYQVFVDTPADLRLARRIERDIRERGRTAESVLMQYSATVRPAHEAFVGAEPAICARDDPQRGPGPWPTPSTSSSPDFRAGNNVTYRTRFDQSHNSRACFARRGCGTDRTGSVCYSRRLSTGSSQTDPYMCCLTIDSRRARSGLRTPLPSLCQARRLRGIAQRSCSSRPLGESTGSSSGSTPSA